MEPIEYLRALRRRWRVIVSCLLLAVAVAYVTAPARSGTSQSTSYTATATLLATPGSEKSVNYLALFVTHGEVPDDAAGQLGYQGDPQVLAEQVVTTADSSTGSLSVTVTDGDPRRAALTANTFAESLVSYLTKQQQSRATQQIAVINKQLSTSREQLQSLQRSIDKKPDDAVVQAQKDAESARYGALYAQLQPLFDAETSGPGINLLQRAVAVPVAEGGLSVPSSRVGRMLVGGVVGLLLGVLAALVLERFDTRLRTRSAVRDAFRLPILAEVPKVSVAGRRNHAIITRSAPGSAAAEAYRALRSSLLLPSAPIADGDPSDAHREAAWAAGDAPQVILAVSAKPREGKTSTIVNLAVTMAEAGKRVLVLDCDFRRPETHRYLDVPYGSGMAELLGPSDDHELMRLSRPTAVPHVRLVTAGRGDEHTVALPARIAQIVVEARDMADVVLIDTTPMLVANDAIDVMPTVDSVLLVARAGRTTREHAERTVELLARLRVPTAGVVLVGAGSTSLRIWHGRGSRYRSSTSGRTRSRALHSRHPSDQGA